MGIYEIRSGIVSTFTIFLGSKHTARNIPENRKLLIANALAPNKLAQASTVLKQYLNFTIGFIEPGPITVNDLLNAQWLL